VTALGLASENLLKRFALWRALDCGRTRFVAQAAIPVRPEKHSVSDQATMADVAELVDAKGLKFSALFESPHLFWKTRPPITIETDGTKRDLENHFRAGFRDRSNEVAV
jgi:hypothetical protein